MAYADISSSIVIECPRDHVAGYSADPDNAPDWYANIKSVKWKTSPPAEVGSQIAFVAHFLGRRMAYTYEVVELVPESRMVMRTVEGPFPMETTYTWEDSDEASTRMTLRNRGRPSGFSSFMTPLVSSMMQKANRKDLARLKKLLEGESAR